MDAGLVQFGVPQGLLHRLEGAAEQVCVELFKARPRDGRVEVDALVQGVDLDVGLGRGGERALGALARRAQTAHCTLVVGNVFLVLALELL